MAPALTFIIVSTGVAGAALAHTLGKKNTRVSYPLEKFHANVSGRGFHNRRFTHRMRQKAASLPNVRLKQGTVISLLKGQELLAYAPITTL